MANWNLPTITSGYINFVAEMNAKFVDAGTLQFGSPINLPENTIRFNRSINIFQELVSGAWVDKVLGIAGGGTGSNTASGIRTNLGLGTMSTQNNNAVNITGGTITGVAFDIGVTTGILPLARGGTGSSLALAGYGAVLLSSGAAVVFDTGTAIQQLNASNLTMGTVPVPRLPSNIAYLNLFNQFTFRQRISNAGGDWPRLTLTDVTGSLNNKVWELNIIAGGGLQVWALNDAESSIMAAFSFQRSGIITAGGFQGSLAANYITGIVSPANLGSGAASAATYLRGDGVWAAIDVGSGGGSGSAVPSGLIGIFDTACPAGWTRYSALDNRFPLGSSGAGGVGGSNDHSHSFDVNSAGGGNHDHSFGGNFSGSGNATGSISGNTAGPSIESGADAGGSFNAARGDHIHNFSAGANLSVSVTTNIDGRTGAGGDHSHRVAGGTNGANHIPPYYTVVFCRKD